jgi:hypothetical protein
MPDAACPGRSLQNPITIDNNDTLEDSTPALMPITYIIVKR